jgi:hypothetical protein
MSKELGIAYSLICLDVAHCSFTEKTVDPAMVQLKANEIAETYMTVANKIKDGNCVGIYHIKMEE